MTDVQDYISGIQGTPEAGQNDKDWTEGGPNNNLSPDAETRPEIYSMDSGLTATSANPVGFSTTAADTTTADGPDNTQDSFRNSVPSHDKTSYLDYQTTVCEKLVDAGVDSASSPEGTSTMDREPEQRDPEQLTDALTKEHVFRIAIEEDISSIETNKSDEQIYYLPLAIGTSGGKSEGESLDFSKLSGLGGKNQSDNVLRDLCKPLSQMAESAQLAGSASSESISNAEPSAVSQTEGTTLSGSTTTSSFITSKSTLVTDSLLKAGSIPESITQQFNQIAKLNKSSLRSRRTVRTTTTRVNPGQVIYTPVAASATSDAVARSSLSERSGMGTVDSTTSKSTSAIPIFSTKSQSVQSSESSPQTSSLFVTPDQKKPIHARFHSDETKPMTDFGSPTRWHSNPCSGDQMSPTTAEGEILTGGATTSTSTTTNKATATRQPVTYVRSVTAERLPVFIRSGEPGIGSTGVLRSKSAAGTISANRHDKSDQLHSTDEGSPDQGVAVVDAHRSMPGSSGGSQGHSSGHTASEDGEFLVKSFG